MALDVTGYLRLSQANEALKVQPAMAARFPGGQCPLFGVMTTVPLIKGTKALIIGPAVCTYNAKLALGLRSLTSIPLLDNLLLLPVQQEDMVFGIGTKVQEAIIEIDKSYRPEVLFVVSTCVLEITGEDLDAVVEEMKSRVNARLIVIHTDHFTETDLAVGVERTLSALVEIMRPASVKENTVSLLGYYAAGAKNTELVCLLASKGIKVKRVIPAVDSLLELISAPAAKMNLVIEPRALPLAQGMREKFGTQYLYCPRPYALNGIQSWYQQIATALNIDVKSEVTSLKTKAEAEMAKFQAKLRGKSFGLRGVSGRPFEVAKFLVDLGMKPIFIHVSSILEQDEENIQAILEAGFDPLLVSGEDSVEIDRLLAELRPDYFIPINYRDLQPATRMGILVRSIEPASSKLGFAASLEVARLLATADSDFGILHYKEQLLQESGKA